MEENDTQHMAAESDSSDESSTGIPEYDLQEPQEKTEQLADLIPSLKQDDDSNKVSLLEMDDQKKKSAYVADGRLNSITPTAKKKQRSIGKTCLRITEAIILTLAMIVIIGLFCLPTVFYALPTVVEREKINKTDSLCSDVNVYSGSVCADYLTSLQTCFSGETSPPAPLNVPSSVDQQEGERNAMSLINGVSFLSPRPTKECREELLPFICHFIFKLCDSNNRLHTIVRQDCLHLRDDICEDQWRQAVMFLGEGVLPVCEEWPDITETCVERNSSSVNSAPINSTSADNQTTPTPNNDTLVCSDGFFYDDNETNVCRPVCGEFRHVPVGIIIAQRVTIVAAFVACLCMFFMALTVERKSLLIFPTILFVYICVTAIVVTGVFIAGFFDNAALFCKYRDFVETVEPGNQTPFCTLSGFVFTYALTQLCTWAVLHAFFLYLAVGFPFTYRRLRIENKLRYAHIICIILALVIPLPGALVHLRDGYVYTATPAFACSGRNLDFTFYLFILPISILIGATSCFLLLILWTIFKEFVLKKIFSKRKMTGVGKAQLKLTVMVFYYIIVGVTGLISFTYFEASIASRERITEHILCESSGVSANCVFDEYDPVINGLSAAVIILLSLLPVLALLFNCKFDRCKKKNAKAGHRNFSRSNTATSQI